MGVLSRIGTGSSALPLKLHSCSHILSGNASRCSCSPALYSGIVMLPVQKMDKMMRQNLAAKNSDPDSLPHFPILTSIPEYGCWHTRRCECYCRSNRRRLPPVHVALDHKVAPISIAEWLHHLWFVKFSPSDNKWIYCGKCRFFMCGEHNGRSLCHGVALHRAWFGLCPQWCILEGISIV